MGAKSIFTNFWGVHIFPKKVVFWKSGGSNFYTQFHHSFCLSLQQARQAAAPSDSAATPAAIDVNGDGAVAAPAASAAAVSDTPSHDRVGSSAATPRRDGGRAELVGLGWPPKCMVMIHCRGGEALSGRESSSGPYIYFNSLFCPSPCASALYN